LIVAADSSALVLALDGVRDSSMTLLRAALRENRLRVSPVVVTELTSNPRITEGTRRLVSILPRLTFHEGYWERAGLLRASLLVRKVRAFVPDVLIAQSCIDHDMPLITYDGDFRHFERAGLKLL
jgi:predicted nucleic acid-binding protein